MSINPLRLSRGRASLLALVAACAAGCSSTGQHNVAATPENRVGQNTTTTGGVLCPEGYVVSENGTACVLPESRNWDEDHR